MISGKTIRIPARSRDGHAVRRRSPEKAQGPGGVLTKSPTDGAAMNDSQSLAQEHLREVDEGRRFRFGRNWRRFLRHLDQQRIERAEETLVEFLEMESLSGKTFLDVGSGSGLFSLAARRLGARVHSFDYDPESVACTGYLKQLHFPGDEAWAVEQGSVLDAEYLARLGTFDVVYAWGVLHHTGDMWRALDLVKGPVKPGGRLFIAIYNDDGKVSLRWRERKKRYCRLPGIFRLPYAILVWAPIEAHSFLHYLRSGTPGRYLDLWRDYYKSSSRGMSRWHDMIDWLGGYPYEFAKAEDLVEFFEKRGYRLRKLDANDGYGCHQIVFERTIAAAEADA